MSAVVLEHREEPRIMIATQLAGNYSVGWALLAGVIGAIAMLPVIYGGRAMGMTKMDLLRTLGSMMCTGYPSRTVGSKAADAPKIVKWRKENRCGAA